MKKSSVRIKVNGRDAVVYEGPRGGKYVKKNGEYVSLRKLQHGGSVDCKACEPGNNELFKQAAFLSAQPIDHESDSPQVKNLKFCNYFAPENYVQKNDCISLNCKLMEKLKTDQGESSQCGGSKRYRKRV